MKTTTFLQGIMIGLGSLMLAVSGQAQARGMTWVPGITKADSGSIVCGGFYKQDLSHRARWILRNENEEGDINIDRIRLYNKTGDLKLDTTLLDPNDPSAGLPQDKNGILGPGQSVLAAHQTARYRSEDIPPLSSNLWGPGNVQVVFDWSADKRVIPPAVSLVRLNYDYSGTILLARSSGKCNRVK